MAPRNYYQFLGGIAKVFARWKHFAAEEFLAAAATDFFRPVDPTAFT